jgi:hypothetical protein
MLTVSELGRGVRGKVSDERLKFLFQLFLSFFFFLSAHVCSIIRDLDDFYPKTDIPSSPNFNPDFATSWNDKDFHFRRLERRISSIGWFKRSTSYPLASSFSTNTLLASCSWVLPMSAT